MRLVRTLWPWGLSTALLVAAFAVVPLAHRSAVLNIGSVVGILLLALPAIRVNEQGRLIERVRALQQGIEACQQRLRQGTLASDVRQRFESSLAQRTQALQKALERLTESKGAWSPAVHRTLYAGYVLVLSTAIARVLFDWLPAS